jgi:hypothetical protein
VQVVETGSSLFLRKKTRNFVSGLLSLRVRGVADRDQARDFLTVPAGQAGAGISAVLRVSGLIRAVARVL